MTCFVCGSNNVITSKEYDMICTNTITTLCICDDCGVEWYDDTQ